MEMTKSRLEEYRSKKAEIAELQYKLDHLGEGNSLIGNDVIMDYRRGYPQPQSVVGYDYDRERCLRNTYQKRIERLKEDCLEVELWIEQIPDSLTRRIFRMCFVDGMTQNKVSRKIHLAQSKVSEKISAYLNRDKKDKKV